jgi:PHS family inorganic phosphate transporter-like MFS transporter
MHETERFEMAKQGAPAINRWALLRQNWRRLVGTAGTWFLLDITFYANGLFSAQVLELSGVGGAAKSGEPPSVEDLLTISRFNIILALAAVPGYWTAVYLIETRLGRKWLQVWGFVLMSALYVVMALTFESVKSLYGVFLGLYALSFFFTNAGPNTTTYVLAAESFPTEVRATLHGISAAAGKLGAALGAGNVFLLLR